MGANFHPHLHALVTKGRFDDYSVFHPLPSIDTQKMALLFREKVFTMLIQEGKISEDLAAKIRNIMYNELMNLFSPDVDIVFYNLTSTYFEGAGPGIAEYGYSRDKRPDQKQIVITLVVTGRDFPSTMRCFPEIPRMFQH